MGGWGEGGSSVGLLSRGRSVTVWGSALPFRDRIAPLGCYPRVSPEGPLTQRLPLGCIFVCHFAKQLPHAGYRHRVGCGNAPSVRRLPLNSRSCSQPVGPALPRLTTPVVLLGRAALGRANTSLPSPSPGSALSLCCFVLRLALLSCASLS